jgi:hypothetical protein
MLDRRGESSDTADEDMVAYYTGHLDKVEFLIRFRPHLEAVYIDYRGVIERPLEQARRIADFLGGGLDANAMAAVVDSSLYRNRAESA